MQDRSPDSLDLRDYIRPLRSRWWMVLLIVAVTTSCTYVYYSAKPKQYAASTTLLLESGSEAGVAQTDPDRAARNDAVLLRTNRVATEVARDIGYEGDPRVLLGLLAVAPAAGTDFLDIVVTAQDPQFAADVANGFARAYATTTDRRARSRARQARLDAQRRLADVPATSANASARRLLAERIQSLRVEENLPATNVSQLEQATAPSTPVGPNPRRNALFALVLAAVIAMTLAYGLELLDRRVGRLEEVGERYGRAVLAAIPAAGRDAQQTPSVLRPQAPFVEPFRSLRTMLQLKATDSADTKALGLRTILVTSAVSGEGKSTVALNLALSYVEAGVSVALIDADLRKPRLATHFGVRNDPGLADVLSGDRPVEAVLRLLSDNSSRADVRRAAAPQSGLRLLVSGQPSSDPAALLAGVGLLRVLNRLQTLSDIVIIDSPPLLAVSDAVALLPAVDGVLLVSRLKVTPTSAVQELNDLLGRVPDVNVLGVVANDVRERIGYGDGYGGGYGDEQR